MEDTIANYLPNDTQQEMSLLLNMLSSAPGMLLLTQIARKPFARLTRAEREAVLLSFGKSQITSKRKAFTGLKQLAIIKFFGTPKLVPNPSWAAMGYDAPESKEGSVGLHCAYLYSSLVVDD